MQNIEWITNFLDDGVIVSFSGKVLPAGVLIAITNSSCLWIFAPNIET